MIVILLGVVSHIGSDGPDAWTLEDPDRQFVLDKMVTAIHRWPVDSDRSINYRWEITPRRQRFKSLDT